MKNFIDEKVVFVLKAYDLIITNVYLLANSSNHKIVFPGNSTKIPRISVLKSFQKYPWNIIRLCKCFCEVKKFKKLFCGLSYEILNIGTLILSF